MASRARVISIGGGKGGTGKSLVAANLAVVLADLGSRTVLIDGDLGAPNLHTLLGVNRPRHTVQSLLDRRIDHLEEAVTPTAIARLGLIAGAAARLGAANPSHAEKAKLLRHVRALDADIVIIDVGAGSSFNALDLFSAALLRLVVVTPQLTSIQNAYCFVKSALLRELKNLAKHHKKVSAWEHAYESGDISRIGSLLERVRADSPQLADAMRDHLSTFCCRVVGNLLPAGPERHSVNAFSRLVIDFLGVEAPLFATIPISTAMHASVGRRTPLLSDPRIDPLTSREFERLAERVLAFEIPRERAETDPTRGLEDDEIDVASLIARHSRRENRIPVNWSAEITNQGVAVDGALTDLSAHGALVYSTHPPRLGDQVEVTVRTSDDSFILSGTVRHVRDSYFGIELDPERILVARGLLELASESGEVTHH